MGKHRNGGNKKKMVGGCGKYKKIMENYRKVWIIVANCENDERWWTFFTRKDKYGKTGWNIIDKGTTKLKFKNFPPCHTFLILFTQFLPSSTIIHNFPLFPKILYHRQLHFYLADDMVLKLDIFVFYVFYGKNSIIFFLDLRPNFLSVPVFYAIFKKCFFSKTVSNNSLLAQWVILK